MNGGRGPRQGPPSVNKRLVLLVAIALVLVAVGVIVWRPLLRSHQLSQGRRALEDRAPGQALQYFHSARQLAPDHAETHFQMARAYRRLGQLDRVHESLKTAWRLGYDVAALKREQWLVLAQTGELKDAEPHLLGLLSDPKETKAAEISEALVRGYFANLRFHSSTADAGRMARGLSRRCGTAFSARLLPRGVVPLQGCRERVRAGLGQIPAPHRCPPAAEWRAGPAAGLCPRRTRVVAMPGRTTARSAGPGGMGSLSVCRPANRRGAKRVSADSDSCPGQPGSLASDGADRAGGSAA